MKLKYFFSLLFVCFSIAVVAQATAKSKKPKQHFKIVTAYTQQIAEDKQTSPPMAGYFFVVKWESSSYPETMFWRGDGGWLTCNIEKAVKSTQNGKTVYTGKETDISKIRKGDVLLLTPVTGGRFPIPAEIPEKAKNTLFYKAGGSAWIAFPVSKISKK